MYCFLLFSKIKRKIEIEQLKWVQEKIRKTQTEIFKPQRPEGKQYREKYWKEAEIKSFKILRSTDDYKDPGRQQLFTIVNNTKWNLPYAKIASFLLLPFLDKFESSNN